MAGLNLTGLLGLLIIPLAYLLDRCTADPAWFPHPVRAIGSLISWLEKPLRRRIKHQRLAGLVLAMIVVGASAAVPAALAWAAFLLHPLLAQLLAIFSLAIAFAAGCLIREATGINHQLGDLDTARQAVARLVSRRTATMDQAGLISSSIETVAENYVDGFVSPLLCATAGLWIEQALGWHGLVAPALVWAFKAVSTLDSMVGYKNARFVEYGRVSAKLDDAMNFIPARLSIGLISLACPHRRDGFDPRSAWQTGWRDRLEHESPNSAHAEAAFAGALGIGFGGPVWYGETLEIKKTIGLAAPSFDPVHLERAIVLLKRSSNLAAGLASLSVVAVFLAGLWR